MADQSRLERLRSIPLFSELDDAGLERVAALAVERTFPAGSVLIERDQPASGMFVIEEGTVAVQLPARTVELGAGEFVGELSLLAAGATRSARVSANAPTRCLAIGRAEFEGLLEEQPRIAVAMLRSLARRLLDRDASP